MRSDYVDIQSDFSQKASKFWGKFWGEHVGSFVSACFKAHGELLGQRCPCQSIQLLFPQPQFLASGGPLELKSSIP